MDYLFSSISGLDRLSAHVAPIKEVVCRAMTKEAALAIALAAALLPPA